MIVALRATCLFIGSQVHLSEQNKFKTFGLNIRPSMVLKIDIKTLFIVSLNAIIAVVGLSEIVRNEPLCEKTGLQVVRTGLT